MKKGIYLVLAALVLAIPPNAFATQYAEVTQKIYVSTADGMAYNGPFATWSEVHDAEVGKDAYYTPVGLSMTPYVGKDGNNFKIVRYFAPVDASALPDNTIIMSANLNLYAARIYNNDPDGNNFVVVVESSQTNPLSLSAEDYSRVGTVELSGRVSLSEISGGQYIAFPLNPAGLKAINPAGWTKLAVREGHDLLNHPYGGPFDTVNSLLNYLAGSGGSYDPYLEITYLCLPADVPVGAAILGYTEVDESEFTSWGCSAQTRVYDTEAIEDSNGNGISEYFQFGTNTAGQPLVCAEDVVNYEIQFFSSGFKPISLDVVREGGNLVISATAEDATASRFVREKRNAATGELVE